MGAPPFPRALLREKSHSWNIQAGQKVAGSSASAFSIPTRIDGGGWWGCTMSDVSLSGGKPAARDRERQKVSTLLWRAVRQICNGGVNGVIVPRNDALFRPWPNGFGQTAGVHIPHGDGSLFSDGAGYYQPIIDIDADAADLRATSLDITINNAGELIGGESFSIRHATMDWRLYEIATVAYSSDTAATITFNPPLREAIPHDTRLEFDRPRCKMRLGQPSSMDLQVVPWTFNSASVDFVESPLASD